MFAIYLSFVVRVHDFRKQDFLKFLFSLHNLSLEYILDKLLTSSNPISFILPIIQLVFDLLYGLQ